MSEVSICNTALSYIRAGGINSLTEGSAQAQQCLLHYSTTRDQVLVAAPWGFAHKLDVLALRTDTLFNWAYLYQYPSDCMHINKLVINFSAVTQPSSGAYRPRLLEELHNPDLDREVPYQVYNVNGQKVIASNYPDLRIDYQVNITDTNLFDINAAEAIARLLASKLAVPLVGGQVGTSYEKAQFDNYMGIVAEAMADNLNERFIASVDSEFVSVRN